MGLLFDLGVSSPQLDDAERGFAYAREAPLDMRMDRTADRTAADIVNGYPAAELARVLRDYGEERFARRIADAVVRERAPEPITSTQRLSAIVKDAIPAATRRTGGNPAKRTFQALRIEVNDELGTLRRALPAALDVLAVGGRVVVLAYHSLEDRIVKSELVRLSAIRRRPACRAGPGGDAEFRLLTRGAERPDAEEVTANPRAASARLRAAERIKGRLTRGGNDMATDTMPRAPGTPRPGDGPPHAARSRHAARARATPARPATPQGPAPRPAAPGHTSPAPAPVSARRHTRPVTGPATRRPARAAPPAGAVHPASRRPARRRPGDAACDQHDARRGVVSDQQPAAAEHQPGQAGAGAQRRSRRRGSRSRSPRRPSISACGRTRAGFIDLKTGKFVSGKVPESDAEINVPGYTP